MNFNFLRRSKKEKKHEPDMIEAHAKHESWQAVVDEMMEVLGEKPSRKSNKSKSTNASSLKHNKQYKITEAREERKGSDWMMIDPMTSTSEEKSVTEGASSSMPKSNEDSSQLKTDS